MQTKLVQYGCGLDAPLGWMNFDASPTLRMQQWPLVKNWAKRRVAFPDAVQFGDIVKGLPIAEASVNAVYCSHVLEHLSLSELELALKNTCRILAPGGVFRLVLPDLKDLVNSYNNDESPEAAIRFMRNTGMATEVRATGIRGFILDWLGNSRHLWLWDYASLKMYLENAGFVDVRRAQFGDSEYKEFETVEKEDRWLGSLGIECFCPKD